VIDSAAAMLMTLGSTPLAIAFAIVVATFVVEDAATIGAALLAASHAIDPPLALTALFIGIFAGDLGLYGLGAAARTREKARKWIGETRMLKGRDWLKRRYLPALIGARFMPGLRLPTYTASGFLGLPFWPFVAVALVAGIVWTGVIFSLVFAYGPALAEQLGAWRWTLAAVPLAILLIPPLIERLKAKA
jgi:membrane protein DedA with SNARE-associated domain